MTMKMKRTMCAALLGVLPSMPAMAGVQGGGVELTTVWSVNDSVVPGMAGWSWRDFPIEDYFGSSPIVWLLDDGSALVQAYIHREGAGARVGLWRWEDGALGKVFVAGDPIGETGRSIGLPPSSGRYSIIAPTSESGEAYFAGLIDREVGPGEVERLESLIWMRGDAMEIILEEGAPFPPRPALTVDGVPRDWHTDLQGNLHGIVSLRDGGEGSPMSALCLVNSGELVLRSLSGELFDIDGEVIAEVPPINDLLFVGQDGSMLTSTSVFTSNTGYLTLEDEYRNADLRQLLPGSGGEGRGQLESSASNIVLTDGDLVTRWRDAPAEAGGRRTIYQARFGEPFVAVLQDLEPTPGIKHGTFDLSRSLDIDAGANRVVLSTVVPILDGPGGCWELLDGRAEPLAVATVESLGTGGVFQNPFAAVTAFDRVIVGDNVTFRTPQPDTSVRYSGVWAEDERGRLRRVLGSGDPFPGDDLQKGILYQVVAKPSAGNVPRRRVSNKQGDIAIGYFRPASPNSGVLASAVDVTLAMARILPTPACDADIDGDAIVDIEDLNILLANFGAGGTDTPSGDITGDGVTDLSDLNALLAVFGQPCE